MKTLDVKVTFPIQGSGRKGNRELWYHGCLPPFLEINQIFPTCPQSKPNAIRIPTGSCGLEEACAPIVVGDGEEGGDERAERVQVRERRGLGAVERIQQHLAPSAARGIHQIGNVPGGDPRRAVDLLEVDLIVQGTRDLLHVNSRRLA